ncbi:hypothetical protein D3C76_75800 [compost metagenome]
MSLSASTGNALAMDHQSISSGYTSKYFVHLFNVNPSNGVLLCPVTLMPICQFHAAKVELITYLFFSRNCENNTLGGIINHGIDRIVAQCSLLGRSERSACLYFSANRVKPTVKRYRIISK